MGEMGGACSRNVAQSSRRNPVEERLFGRTSCGRVDNTETGIKQIESEFSNRIHFKSIFLCNVRACALVVRYQPFASVLRVKRFLLKFGTYLPNYTTSHPRRRQIRRIRLARDSDQRLDFVNTAMNAGGCIKYFEILE
jgi:hypothetical protein